MKSKRNFTWRYIAMAVLMLLCCVVYVGRLANVQIISRDDYTVVNEKTYSRTVKIQAHRGEIYDRNGKPLVTNVLQYDFVIDFNALPGGDGTNVMLLSAIEALKTVEEIDWTPASLLPFTGEYPDLSLDLQNASAVSKYKRFLASNAWDEDISAESLINKLVRKYDLIDDEGEARYDNETMKTLLLLRYSLEVHRLTSAEPYLLADDVSLELITYVEEHRLEGPDFYERVSRVYHYPGYASHILGRVDKIFAEEWDYYNAQGYPMDAVVGKSGVEYAFEEYLRGQDGELTIIEDEDGRIIDSYVSVEPVAGKSVWLTLDIDMQIAAEDALAANILYINQKAAQTPGEYDGEDAAKGALTAIGVNTGEVYAIASYPTYDLTTFNADYAELSTNPDGPFVNRALEGRYAPGSTFKIGVAAAALTEGIITPNTYIETKGIYEYYAPSYTPRCWYYLRYHGSHGNINVVKALQVSCNYFFYEVGRLLTIDKITQYMSSYGLGQPTGIELPEKTGVLAGPDYRDDNGLDPWSGGDTLQAAIGQSDNLVTPLQLSVYMSTIANGGTRYAAHLLHSVRSFYDNEIIYAYEPQVVSTATLRDRDYSTLMTALKSVTEDDGSAARLFRDYAIEVGGKTGTAQVSKTKSDNAVFTAFAPWNDPEIAVSCIIEQGANGTDAGVAVREVFDYYFQLGDYAPEAQTNQTP
ncbi:MAG: hypothetical protein IJF49_04050 [Clostridia bacterium]|nr:hypothetical protein [Clostridia bacterium]